LELPARGFYAFRRKEGVLRMNLRQAVCGGFQTGKARTAVPTRLQVTADKRSREEILFSVEPGEQGLVTEVFGNHAPSIAQTPRPIGRGPVPQKPATCVTHAPKGH
jgi:hypothetical protein